ncbi:glucuronate isomerase [Proteiniclasticum sp. BAD-10]|uniref:Uronate isomerase n=1 Tax=Proteiniclasticum sediminis TaxID=2804028 RepID=A0A941CLY8_9CLOT|nr:glucuronate isomerase [Proteiniclasticum sediminis]
MMSIINDHFMLKNETARTLYHEYAKNMPIYDYHCHLNPQLIAEDARFKNITEIWLGGDHYKWRAMRSNGVPEDKITGSASDFEKFKAFCETIPYTIGNPLYHWSHLELKMYFGIEDTINGENAEKIWEKANAVIASPDFSVRKLIEKSNVAYICTTDDLADSLEYHDAIKADESFKTKVLPALRPDKLLNIDKPGFAEYLGTLSSLVGYPVDTLEALNKAVAERVEFFHAHGARLSDHALDVVTFKEATAEELEAILTKALKGDALTFAEVTQYKTAMLLTLGKLYHDYGWVQQYHIGAMRNNNTRMMKKLGADTGYDSINDGLVAEPLSRLMDALDSTDSLPKTILYCLNARDNDVLATLAGAFQSDEAKMKVQVGSGWWFNDQKDGMEKQMVSLANLGLLRRFVGMLTDSRSFISYPRHDYFRRILCNLLGTWAEEGEIPMDLELLGSMVKEISFENAVEYFNM